MKVKILVEGPYSDFRPSGKVGAVHRNSGDEVDYPKQYAEGLIEAGLAELLKPDVLPEPVKRRRRKASK